MLITEKILILVKTYPAFSKKYFELVCTAGINQAGERRRIYPIPFRSLPELEKYKKFQWVEFNIERNFADPRPESFKLVNQKITILDEIPTENSWKERKEFLFNKTKVYENLDEIIAKAKNKQISLCIFKPKKIVDFKVVEETEREWKKEILDTIKAENDQLSLLPELEKEIKIVDKLPYKFSYCFEDDTGKQSTLMIEDWEIGELFWKCLRRKKNEKSAIEDVIKKYKNLFLEKKDIYLFLGTTKQFHFTAKNPYVITGVFYPPKDNQFYMKF